MHITNQKISFDIFTVGNFLNLSIEHDLYLIILMIFGIKEKSIILIQTVLYCYKYTHAAWFCDPGSHIMHPLKAVGYSSVTKIHA